MSSPFEERGTKGADLHYGLRCNLDVSKDIPLKSREDNYLLFP